VKLKKFALPILWFTAKGTTKLAAAIGRLEFNVLMPMMDKIDKSYLDRRYASELERQAKEEEEFHVVPETRDIDFE
jgi:hypothetical protein